jgi:three-Cys-motif partner protein
MVDAPRFDEIDYWSEVKLDIIRDYASAYSRILSKQPLLHHVYIDGFAGAGRAISKGTGNFVPGSPLNALQVEPSFREYFLIDLDPNKAGYLKREVGQKDNVHVLEGDCNEILLRDVLPQVRFEQYRRGLCLLDPYGLHLEWPVIEAAGKSRAIDLFLNFPIMDANRNALWRDPERVAATQAARWTTFWGDESWKKLLYRPRPQLGLFRPEIEKVDNPEVAAAFRERLRTHAGFAHVAEPLPMRNRTGAVVYYLYFATQKGVANHIVKDIFAKYADRARGGA